MVFPGIWFIFGGQNRVPYNREPVYCVASIFLIVSLFEGPRECGANYKCHVYTGRMMVDDMTLFLRISVVRPLKLAGYAIQIGTNHINLHAPTINVCK